MRPWRKEAEKVRERILARREREEAEREETPADRRARVNRRIRQRRERQG